MSFSRICWWQFRSNSENILCNLILLILKTFFHTWDVFSIFILISFLVLIIFVKTSVFFSPFLFSVVHNLLRGCVCPLLTLLVNFINQFLLVLLNGYLDYSYAIPLLAEVMIAFYNNTEDAKLYLKFSHNITNIKRKHLSLLGSVQNSNTFTYTSNTNLSLRIQDKKLFFNFKPENDVRSATGWRNNTAEFENLDFWEAHF